MGLAPQSSTSAFKSGAPTDPTFIPICPGCRYDLRGIPDGVCPECGRSFTFDKLHADALLERLQRETGIGVSPDWLLATILIPSLFCSPLMASARSDEVQVRAVWTAIAWAVTIYWLVRRLDLGFGRGGWRLGWLAFPSAWLLVSILGEVDQSDTTTGLLAATISLLAGLAWSTIRAGRGWLFPLIVGGLLILAGTLLLSEVAIDAAAGREWSRIADPRPGQVYDQYPLQIREAHWLSWSMVGTGCLAALFGLLLNGRALRKLTVPPTRP